MRPRGRNRSAWRFATLAIPFLATPTLFAQAPPASDRAGKDRLVDSPPADPRPAAGTVYRADQVAQPTPAGAVAQPDPGRAPVSVVGSHQIDRYDALAKLQQSTKDNPKALTDWIILGEIAHEVAMDAPADKAGGYFSQSRDAFEKASALDPGNQGLKAAVQFARDQQANADAFEKSRDSVTDTFLDARRRDLAATGNMPAIQVYGPAAPPRTLPGPAPAQPAAVGNLPRPVAAGTVAPREGLTSPTATTGTGVPADAANYGTRADYSAPLRSPTGYPYPGASYQPFATPDGVPYTYQQYNSTYYPPNAYGNNSAPPMTLQRYTQQIVPNAIEQQIFNRANPALRP